MAVNISAVVFWKCFSASDSSTFVPVDVARAWVLPSCGSLRWLVLLEKHTLSRPSSVWQDSVSTSNLRTLITETLPFSGLFGVDCTSAVISLCRTKSRCGQAGQSDTRLWLIWNVKPHGRRVSIFGHRCVWQEQGFDWALLNQLEGNVLDSV